MRREHAASMRSVSTFVTVLVFVQMGMTLAGTPAPSYLQAVWAPVPWNGNGVVLILVVILAIATVSVALRQGALKANRRRTVAFGVLTFSLMWTGFEVYVDAMPMAASGPLNAHDMVGIAKTTQCLADASSCDSSIDPKRILRRMNQAPANTVWSVRRVMKDVTIHGRSLVRARYTAGARDNASVDVLFAGDEALEVIDAAIAFDGRVRRSDSSTWSRFERRGFSRAFEGTFVRPLLLGASMLMSLTGLFRLARLGTDKDQP